MSTPVIYAIGGGLGHLSRAVQLARRIGPCTILHSACKPLPAPPNCVLVSPRAPAAWLEDQLDGRPLYVDTFPAGLQRELHDGVLSRASHTTLIARHLRPESYPDHAALTDRFERVWLPYREDECGWEGELPGVYIGPAVRQLAHDHGPRAPLAVIGRGLPPGWLEVLPPGTRHVDTWFDALPNADRYLCVGAGHNLVWELIEAGQTALHLPLHRRFDDQHRRALRLGRAALSRSDVIRFVREVA